MNFIQIVDAAPRDDDAEVMYALNTDRKFSGSGDVRLICICNETGQIYRCVTARGVDESRHVETSLEGLNFVRKKGEDGATYIRCDVIYTKN
jgi:hypothetical protein